MHAQLIDVCAKPELQDQVDDVIARMEGHCSVRIVCYSLMGSIPLGMGNASSDYDVLAFYKPQQPITPSQYDVINNKVPLLGAAHVAGQVNLLLADIELCSAGFVEMPESEFSVVYPHHLNTLTVHDRAFDISVVPGTASPKVASIFSDMFYYGNGVLTDRCGAIRDNFSEMKHFLRVYDFCKRRFVTTYGRLQHYLVEQGNVRLRTYLQSINDLLAIEYALDHRDIPPPDISVMLNYLDDAPVLEIARRYLDINGSATTAKEKLLIDPDMIMNQWIAERLARIRPRLVDLYPQRGDILFNVYVD
ncbi:putative nucleotidyltransferase [compost metagenome]